MRRKSNSRKSGNAPGAWKRVAAIAFAEGISVLEACPGLVISPRLWQDGHRFSLRVDGTGIQGAPAKLASPKGNSERPQRTHMAGYSERNDRRLS